MRQHPDLAYPRWAEWPLAAVAVPLAATMAVGCTSSSLVNQAAQPSGAALAPVVLHSSPDHLVDRPVASGGCGRHPAIRPGTTALVTVAVPPASAAGARYRSYWLHVPVHYSAAREVPLVLAFHGGGGTSIGMERSVGLDAVADRDGFLVAYPQALGQDHGRVAPVWDASGPGDPYAAGIDDGLFVSDVLNSVQASYCVDPARIWATGISNGGSLVGYLACVLADRVAAFAPVEGVFFQIPGGCHPAHPAAIFDVHVRTDPIAPYAGVPSRGSPDYFALAVPRWLRGWAHRDRCSPVSFQIAGVHGIRIGIWPHCPAGARVVGYVLPSGGHSWFRSIGAAAGDSAILSFFRQHPLRPVQSWVTASGGPAPQLAAPRIAIRSIRIFRLPRRDAEPFDIAASPDGSMWFTEYAANMIGRISPAGVISQFKVPTAGTGPYQITADAHGAVWFTEYNTTKIGLVRPNGQVTEFPLAKPTYGGTGIVSSGGRSVLAADPAGFVRAISAGGAVTSTRVPSVFGLPFAIARLGDGTLWISELTGYYEFSRHLLSFPAGSGTPSRTLTLPNPLSDVVALAAGPGGTIWFATSA